ncbi:MAG: hypothetical protein ACE5KD_02520 [Candidatus Bathyarchaeia archaeon]
MLVEIDTKIKEVEKTLKQLDYVTWNVSAKEFHDYMTGEIFSEDITTLQDVLDSKFLMLHEIVEISELKKMGRTINKQTIMKTPKTTIYEAHFTAMEYELNYALLRREYSWIRERLKQHKLVLIDDPCLPEKLKPRGEAIFERFSKLIRKYTK